MQEKEIWVGGFYLPKIYQKDQKQVEAKLEQGEPEFTQSFTH